MVRTIDARSLRRRKGVKWDVTGDVIAMGAAEADVYVAAPIRRALHRSVRLSDTGAMRETNALFEGLSGFAQRRWEWSPDPASMLVAPSVSSAVGAILGASSSAGGKVVFSSPVYGPFRHFAARAGLEAIDVPLLPKSGWSLDLVGLETVFAGGNVAAYLLCHPQNPTGRVHDKVELEGLARLAWDHGVRVVSDEIHAPLAHGAAFSPFLKSAGDAGRASVSVASATKAWNLAGVGCAIIVCGDEATAQQLRRDVGAYLRWETGRFGVVAAEAAYVSGIPWLDSFNKLLRRNAKRIEAVIGGVEGLATVAALEGGYLAWLDLNRWQWDDPAEILLRRARVAVVDGREFGATGHGYCRLNYATSGEILGHALARLQAIRPSGS